MVGTTLHDVELARGARMAEYLGVKTAAAFGDVALEFEALQHGCAVSDLGWRAKLLVTGPDRVRWLNGMVTNNVRDLATNRGNYNFLLNAQGRIQGDLYIYNRGEYLLLDTDASQREHLRELLDKYIIMDDVGVSPADEKLTAIGIGGPRAPEALARAGMPAELAELELRDFVAHEVGISLVRRGPKNFEIWMAPENAAGIWDALIQAGATPVGSEALEIARIAAGIPRYGVDIRERDLPQETCQSQALNFTKGCYVGQEIVERIHSRGLVHRQFTGFVFANALPPIGAIVEMENKNVGEITSVAALPSSNGTRMIGLGYIRREAGAPGTEVAVAGAKARVAELPFENL